MKFPSGRAVALGEGVGPDSESESSDLDEALHVAGDGADGNSLRGVSDIDDDA